jgi:hypothetical protein
MGRDHLQDLDVARRIILKLILQEQGYEGLDWIHSAQDMNQ